MGCDPHRKSHNRISELWKYLAGAIIYDCTAIKDYSDAQWIQGVSGSAFLGSCISYRVASVLNYHQDNLCKSLLGLSAPDGWVSHGQGSVAGISGCSRKLRAHIFKCKLEAESKEVDQQPSKPVPGDSASQISPDSTTNGGQFHRNN